MTLLSASFLYWAVPSLLLLLLLLVPGYLLWKGKWRLSFFRRPGQAGVLEQSRKVLKRMGMEYRELKEEEEGFHRLSFTYKRLMLVMEMHEKEESLTTSLVIPNLYSATEDQLGGILFCMNRFNLHPTMTGRAVACLLESSGEEGAARRPEVNVRLIHPFRLSGDARRDAARLSGTLEDLVASTMWLLFLIGKMTESRPEASEGQGGLHDAGQTASDEQLRLMEVMNFLDPKHLLS